jgi:hypothetical protein
MLSRNVLRMLYVSYVHSVTHYSIIFWCNTPNGIKIFILKYSECKQNFRNYDLFKKMVSHTELFKKMEIFTFLFWVYIFSFIGCSEQTNIYKEIKAITMAIDKLMFSSTYY